MKIFKKDWLSLSLYPHDFIPKDASIFVGVDIAKDSDCTIKGFIDKDGIIHIQECEYNEKNKNGNRARI